MTENRGGRRPGAGRKPKGETAGKKITLYLTGDLIQALHDQHPELTTPAAARRVITDNMEKKQ